MDGKIRISSGWGPSALCSDGLTDLVDDDAIRQVLVDCRESAETCRRLVDLALDSGGKDNVTVVIAGYTFNPRLTMKRALRYY